VEAEAMETVKVSWKRKHFEKRSLKRKQTRKPEAGAFFIKHEGGKRKRLNLCGSGSTLKKEAGSESKLGSD